MKRVLVTGGNGFVGRPLVSLLREQGHEVSVLDNLRSGRRKLPEGDRLTFFQADLREPPAVADCLARFRPEVVIHLAAVHYIPECEGSPGLAQSINEGGTVTLLDALAPGTRFVLASTAAVYAPSDLPHGEEDEIRPADVYGYTKLHAEAWVRYYARKRSLAATLIRLFNVAGPGETNPHILPAIVKQLARGDVLRLGNTAARRDYINVRDAVSAFATVGLAPGEPGRVDVVNAGTGNAYAVTDLVDLFARQTGRPLRIEVDGARLRPVDRPFASADITRIGRVYGWRPRHTLDEAIAAILADPDIEPAVLELA